MNGPHRYSWDSDPICRQIVAHVAKLSRNRGTVAAIVSFSPDTGTEHYRRIAEDHYASFTSEIVALLGSTYMVASFAFEDAAPTRERFIESVRSVPWDAGALFINEVLVQELLPVSRLE